MLLLLFFVLLYCSCYEQINYYILYERVRLISIESTRVHNQQFHFISFYVLILSGCLYETFAKCEFFIRIRNSSARDNILKSFERKKQKDQMRMNAFQLLAVMTAKILHANCLKITNLKRVYGNSWAKLFHSIWIGM